MAHQIHARDGSENRRPSSFHIYRQSNVSLRFLLNLVFRNEEQLAEEAQLWHTTLIMRVTEGAIPDQWSFHTSRSEYKLSGKICIKEMVFLGLLTSFN